MDQTTFRKYVDDHTAAMVAGEMDKVLEDFTDELKPEVPSVAALLPQPVKAADIVSLRLEGEQFVTEIRYSGAGSPLMVEATWEVRDGRPLIAAARPV